MAAQNIVRTHELAERYLEIDNYVVYLYFDSNEIIFEKIFLPSWLFQSPATKLGA